MNNSETYEENTHSCSICLTDFVPFLAMGVCQHPICNICALRLRCKSKNTTCAICKTNLFGMIVYSVNQAANIPNTAAFTALEYLSKKHADDSSPLHMIWQKQRIHFPDCLMDRVNQLIYYKAPSLHQQMEDFQCIHCPFTADCPHTKFNSYKQLLSHLHQRFHPSSITTPIVPGNTPPNKTLCQLCLEHRPLFISEQLHYTKKELKSHLHQDHHYCPFCNQYLFDKNLFYQHLQHKHHICHLCDQNMMFRYYKDLSSLREHHRQVHYICWQCDHNPDMRNSDISYAYRTLEEYCQHMREFHSINETSYRKGNNSQGNSLFNLFSFGNNGGNNNRSTAQDLVFYDLDVGSANPFPNTRASTATSNQEMKESGDVRLPRIDPSRMMMPTAHEAEEVANLIPANMKIAGKVTGTGRFQKLNEEDLSLQEAADLAHKLTYAKMMRNGNVSQQELLSNLQQSFPSLQVTNTTNDEADVVFIDKLENNESEEGKNSSTGYFTNLSMKVGATKAAHPLSLVGKKPATPNPNDNAAKEEKEKKVSRALLLAEAFGIADNVSKMSETFQQAQLDPSQQHQQIDEYKKYLQGKLPADIKLPPTPSSAPSFLLFTLYPMDLMIWGKANKFELIKIEKKFSQLLTTPKNHSVSLKPMDYHDRQMMHILAKYYHCNSYEYDYEPKRYVSIVKTAASCSPFMLLSDAIAFLPMSVNNAIYTSSLNKLYTTTGIENPIIYFVLANDLLLSAWGKGTDNTLVTKKTTMNASQLFSLLPFKLHGTIVGELIYYLQEILHAFDIMIIEIVFSSNCYSVGIKFKDFIIARNAYYYLTMIYEAIQSILPQNMMTSTSSKKNAIPLAGNDIIFKKLLDKFDHQLLLYLAYYRMTPDFVVNSNTKEEFDQYHNIFQEFIVVRERDVVNDQSSDSGEDVYESQLTGKDAWDDDSTPVITSDPTPLNLSVKSSHTLPQSPLKRKEEEEGLGGDDWEDIQEWEEFLAEKRMKQQQSTTTPVVTATSNPPVPLYQAKKISAPSMPLTVPQQDDSSEESDNEEEEEEIDSASANEDEETKQQEQVDADFALALALSEGNDLKDVSSTWQPSSTSSKKLTTVTTSTSRQNSNPNNRPSNAKPIAVVKNRFNLLNEEEDSD